MNVVRFYVGHYCENKNRTTLYIESWLKEPLKNEQIFFNEPGSVFEDKY